jgi:hypothetical protein
VALAVLASAVVLAVVGGTFLLAPRPVGTSGPAATGPLPISTGAIVQPSGPGQSPVVSADSVPFERPMYPYQGSKHWQILTPPGGSRVLEGYASRPSYLPGETLRLAVSTSAPTYALSIWRVSGEASPDAPFVHVASQEHLAGGLQPGPTVDPATKMVAAHWQFRYSLAIPASWPSGMYLIRLASDEGVQSYVPFVVRSQAAHAVLVVSSALNWQAYNDWGGSSLYETRVGDPAPGVSHAYAVSFDRPYATDGGAGQLFFLELPLIAWLERQGLDLAYTTDYDLSLAPDAAPPPNVVVFNGHSEYWGVPLYAWLDAHVNGATMGLAMFAADTGYWPISFGAASADGPRDFVCLRDGPAPQALLPPGQTAEPAEAPGATPPPGDVEERSGTGFQALGPTGPYVGSFADQPVFGVRYRGITSALGRYSIDPAGADPRLLEGTGLAAGGSLGFIAGGEVDGVYPSAEWWGPLGGAYDHRFAASLDIPGRTPEHRWTAEAVWRELPGGGHAFSAGTFYWGWALDPAWGSRYQVPAGFGRLTLNILRFLGAR